MVFENVNQNKSKNTSTFLMTDFRKAASCGEVSLFCYVISIDIERQAICFVRSLVGSVTRDHVYFKKQYFR